VRRIYEASGKSLRGSTKPGQLQWLRMIGDIVFATGAVVMALDFVLKLRPLFPGRFRRLATLEIGPAAGE